MDDQLHIFQTIFEQNIWADPESVSGSGSNMKQTEALRQKLPALLQELNVKSILDIPCGDFYWMQHVNLSDIHYIGADIVEELVAQNQKSFSNNARDFVKLDVTSDTLPDIDLILCRDCLPHFANELIFKALDNIVTSNATWLLATTLRDVQENKEIRTGCWRPLNLEQEPFNFPPPAYFLNEACSEGGGSYSDKGLGLWPISLLRTHLNKS